MACPGRWFASGRCSVSLPGMKIARHLSGAGPCVRLYPLYRTVDGCLCGGGDSVHAFSTFAVVSGVKEFGVEYLLQVFEVNVLDCLVCCRVAVGDCVGFAGVH